MSVETSNQQRSRPDHPLGEVFGFVPSDQSPEAKRARRLALCPFGNRVPNCTKDKASDPLGVCSVRHAGGLSITCPVRFRQHWIIAENAASFLFPEAARWTTLSEVRLKDGDGGSAGNIDVVLCQYDDAGRVIDFGALEVQAVYISGNIRRPFEAFMKQKDREKPFDWTGEENFPHPDFLSSSRKRLAPQLLFKGGILKSWGKKTVVALDEQFFDTLPLLEQVNPEDADICWAVYALMEQPPAKQLQLTLKNRVFTRFSESLDKITRPKPGDASEFISNLQRKLDVKLDRGSSPDTEVIDAPF